MPVYSTFYSGSSEFVLYRRYRIYFHLLFWFLYIGSITFFFGDFVGIIRVLIRTTVAAGFNAGLAYFNLYYLLPRYFEKRKYILYLVLVNGAVLITGFLRLLSDYLFPLLSITETNPIIGDYIFTVTHFSSILISAYIILLITSSIQFIKEYFVSIQLRNQLKYEKVRSELHQLKNQLNPHFLFNVLSNLYSMIELKSDLAAPMVMKLSGLLRYALYECNADKVLLEKEVEYLRSFIALHQFRKENEMNIQFETEGDLKGVLIEPMLFLPIYENCFKHGNLDDTVSGWMHSVLSINNGKLTLYVENSYLFQPEKNSAYGGVGIRNIENRLKLLYGKSAMFKVTKKSGVYSVFLEMDISKNFRE
ncbi:MAG: histidine kinase [Bacteroidales bacterium]|nr:histidine kinase [Bacteroidales bacterium]